MPNDNEVFERINEIRPAALANDVLVATHDLGGEAQRAAIIDRALELGGWTAEELAVRSHISGAARTYHLRTCADYAITTCSERGHLEAVDGQGRWRLTMAPRLTGHPFDRVFTAGVGVGTDPVPDDWSAADQTHLWFSKMSRQIGRGDHIFALGAGRRSAVLGVFEVTSPGVAMKPANPWDPDRWPYVAAVRALAAVPPSRAISIEGVVAPRGAPPLIRDAALTAGLYAAVDGYAVIAHKIAGAAPAADIEQADPTTATRTPRRFDPTHRPTPRRVNFDATPEADGETLQLQEKANQNHHDLMVSLHRNLEVAGWTDLEEIERAIDLRGRRGQTKAIFEAKTIGETNETSQCRSALAQLLEYRLDYGNPNDELCVVVDRAISQRRANLLDRLGVGALFVDGGELRPINPAAASLLS